MLFPDQCLMVKRNDPIWASFVLKSVKPIYGDPFDYVVINSYNNKCLYYWWVQMIACLSATPSEKR